MVGRDVGGRHFGQDVGDHGGVLRAVVRPPIRLVDLLLDPLAFERSIGKGVCGDQIQIVGAQEFLEARPFLRVGRQPVGRVPRDSYRDAERLVRTEAGLDLRQIAIEARPHFVPGVTWMDERRIDEVTEISAQFHPLLPGILPNGSGSRPAAVTTADESASVPTTHAARPIARMADNPVHAEVLSPALPPLCIPCAGAV